MEIFEIIGKLLGAVVVAILAYFAPKIKAWMNVHMNKTMVDNVVTLIDSFVRAADQLYHDDDHTGEKRNAYVKKQLMLAGVEISETVINLIEGAVFDVNIACKSVADFDDSLPVATSGYIETVTTSFPPVESEKKSTEKKTTSKATSTNKSTGKYVKVKA